MTEFAATLLQWYRRNGRSLPWRGITNPYYIWVSEIILQQTRVVQGYDYYERFIKAFPTVESLAEANEDDVLRQWQGLGYYSRARNLHFAARQIQALGTFPTDYEAIRSLKGVGDYTAAAIYSFAFQGRKAVVDGNVYRVLSRYFGIDEPIDTTAGKKYFARLADTLLPERNIADYNQALMDFGALQCVPSTPCCDTCPLSASCMALAQKRVSDFPKKEKRTKVAERYFSYIRVKTPKGVWMRRRGEKDIWKGLYEYCLVETKEQIGLSDLLHTPFVRQLPPSGKWKEGKQKVKHVLTHRVLWLNYYTLTYEREVPIPEGYQYIPYEEVSRYAKPKPLIDF